MKNLGRRVGTRRPMGNRTGVEVRGRHGLKSGERTKRSGRSWKGSECILLLVPMGDDRVQQLGEVATQMSRRSIKKKKKKTGESKPRHRQRKQFMWYAQFNFMSSLQQDWGMKREDSFDAREMRSGYRSIRLLPCWPCLEAPHGLLLGCCCTKPVC